MINTVTHSEIYFIYADGGDFLDPLEPLPFRCSAIVVSRGDKQRPRDGQEHRLFIQDFLWQGSQPRHVGLAETACGRWGCGVELQVTRRGGCCLGEAVDGLVRRRHSIGLPRESIVHVL